MGGRDHPDDPELVSVVGSIVDVGPEKLELDMRVERLMRAVKRVAGRRKGESPVSENGDYVDIGR